MAQRQVKAKYRVKPLGKVTVYINQARMVNEKGSEVPSKVDKQVAVEQEMFMVYFPAGHSIRINKEELVRMGYHLRPRLIDMETGDVVEIGGDPYSFMGMDADGDDVDPSVEIILQDDDDDDDQEQEQAKAKAAK